MKKRADHGNITQILALAVFGIFAVCAALVLLTGAEIYRDLNMRSSEGFENRTAAQYITTRVRQAADISVEKFDGNQALAIRETIDGDSYVTWVYCYDGYMRELLSIEGAKAAPEHGETILEAEALHFSWEDGLLYVRIVYADGTAQQLFLYVPGERVVGP